MTSKRLLYVSIGLVTGLLNALKMSHDFWGNTDKQAQYKRLLEYRSRLVQLAQFGNVRTA